MSSFKVIVVGSGLSGSLLANGLVREGVDCTVYERSARTDLREGYQIRLGEGALTGMRAALTKEHMQKIVDHFGKVSDLESDAPIVYDTNFNQLLDLGKIPNYSKSAPISRVVLRDLLCNPLYDAGKLKYNKQFVKYTVEEQAGRERIHVHFADGSSDDCDILIGGDGNSSKINKQLGLNNIELLDTHIIIQTKCDLPEAGRAKLDPRLMKCAVGTSSNNIAYYFCVYEVAKLDATANTGKEEKPSCMLGVTLPANVLPENFQKLPTDKKWDIMIEALNDWSPEHLSTLELLRGQDIYVVWPRVGHRPQLTWRRDAANKGDKSAGHPQVWLIGDAIHPMLPNRGQGGNTAMNDTADALPQLVKLAMQAKSGAFPTKLEIETACKQYESLMIPRAFEWVRKSGGNKIMAFDTNKMLDWAIILIFSHIMPLLKLGNAALSILSSKKPHPTNELA